MTSQRSTNNNTVPFGKLLAQALRRGNWMWALSILASFLFGPVLFLFVLQSYESNYKAFRAMALTADQINQIAINMEDYLTGTHACLQLLVVIVGAFIVSVFGFRYLYHRRSADLYASMPVARGRQFLAQYLAGFLIWFVPFIAGHIVILLICVFHLGGNSGTCVLTLLNAVLTMVLDFLIVYHACLVAVQLSGNVANALLNSVLYGIWAIMVWVILYYNASHYFHTLCVASPTWTQLFAGLSPLAASVMLTINLLDTSTPTYPMILAPAACMMLADFFLAKRLGDLRPSELAEHGLECKLVRILMRGSVSVGTGLLLGLFFGILGDSGAEFGWIVFGCIFGTVLSFAVLNVVYHANFRELFAHKLQLVICTVLSIAIMLCFYFDLFGYDAYVADEDQITGIAVQTYGLSDASSRYVWDAENGEYVYHDGNNDFVTIPEISVSDIYQMLTGLADTSRLMNDYTSVLSVRVSTRTGSYYRTYEVYLTDADLIAPLVETDTYRETFYAASSGLWQPQSMEYYHTRTNSDSDDLLIEDAERVQQLYEAYQADFLEQYSAESILNSTSYAYTHDTAGYLNINSAVTVDVPSTYTRTLSLLEEWGG